MDQVNHASTSEPGHGLSASPSDQHIANLQAQLNDANEMIEGQFKQVHQITEEFTSMQDAMRMKDSEIERLQREVAELGNAFGNKAGFQVGSPMEIGSGPAGMNNNIEL